MVTIWTSLLIQNIIYDDGDFAELYVFKCTSLLISPNRILIVQLRWFEFLFLSILSMKNLASLWFFLLFVSILSTCVLKLRWSGVSIEDRWRNEQFWVYVGTWAHLFAVFQGLLKALVDIDINFTVTSKASYEDVDFAEIYIFKWTSLIISPTKVLIVNMVGIKIGVSGTCALYGWPGGKYQTRSWTQNLTNLLFLFAKAPHNSSHIGKSSKVHVNR